MPERGRHHLTDIGLHLPLLCLLEVPHVWKRPPYHQGPSVFRLTAMVSLDLLYSFLDHGIHPLRPQEAAESPSITSFDEQRKVLDCPIILLPLRALAQEGNEDGNYALPHLIFLLPLYHLLRVIDLRVA